MGMDAVIVNLCEAVIRWGIKSEKGVPVEYIMSEIDIPSMWQ